MTGLRSYLDGSYIESAANLTQGDLMMMICQSAAVVFDIKLVDVEDFECEQDKIRELVKDSVLPVRSLKLLGELKNLLRCDEPKIIDLARLPNKKYSDGEPSTQIGVELAARITKHYYKPLYSFLRLRADLLARNDEVHSQLEIAEDKLENISDQQQRALDELSMTITEHRVITYDAIIKQYLDRINEINTRTREAERNRDAVNAELQDSRKRQRSRDADLETTQSEFNCLCETRAEAENELKRLKDGIVENHEELREKAQEATKTVRREEHTTELLEDELKAQDEAKGFPAQYEKFATDINSLINSIDNANRSSYDIQTEICLIRESLDHEKLKTIAQKKKLTEVEIHQEKETAGLESKLHEIKNVLKMPIQAETELQNMKNRIPELMNNLARLEAEGKEISA